VETWYPVFQADLVKAMRLRSNRFGVEVELAAYTAKAHARVRAADPLLPPHPAAGEEDQP
jgi:hypothetical protein